MTLAEFLKWEERQELRFEFDGVRPVDRNGGTAAHAIIQTNALVALRSRTRGTAFETFGSILKFLTGVQTVRYPDAMVVAGRSDPRATMVKRVLVVVEALDDATSRIDRIVKAREYQATPSVRHYVMLERDAPGAVVYSRSGDAWTHESLIVDSVLALPAIGVEIPLAEIYEGVDFEDDGA